MKKEIIGVSEHIKDLRNHIERAAKTDSTVLIQGPTGTGKELVANNIHYKSNRKDKPFFIINCAAIPPELFESELFGHTRGAYSGAIKDKTGAVELVSGGTLFLDEIGDLIKSHQAKILRFLEDGSYCPVGGTPKKVNVRIIVATNKNLFPEDQSGSFRKDLYYRLGQYPIYTLPLADRPADVICLVNHFVHEKRQTLDDRAKILLYSYPFPGNVRELRNRLDLTDYNFIRKELEKAWAIRKECSRTPTSKQDLKAINIDPFHISKREIDPFTKALNFVDRNDVDFKKCVEAYEIVTLKQLAKLGTTDIVNILHIRKNRLTPSKFKEHYGFDFPSKNIRYFIDSPAETYPHPKTLADITSKTAKRWGFTKGGIAKFLRE